MPESRRVPPDEHAMRTGWRVHLPVALLAALGFVASFVLWQRAVLDDEARVETAFDRRVSERVAILSAHLDALAPTLQSVQGLFRASDFVSTTELERFVASLRPWSDGLAAIVWAREQATPATPSFAVRPTSLRGRLDAVDWTALPGVAAAQQRARATGIVAASEAFDLERIGLDAHRGVTLWARLLSGDGSPAGWIVGVLDGTVLAERALGSLETSLVEVALRRPSTGRSDTLVFQQPGRSAGGTERRRTVSVVVSGEAFEIELVAGANLVAFNATKRAPWLLVSGLLGTTVVSLAAAEILRRAERMGRLARLRAGELREVAAAREREAHDRRESEERLREMVERVVGHALVELGPDARIVRWNADAERLLGWRPDDAVGKTCGWVEPPDGTRVIARSAEWARIAGSAWAEGACRRSDGSQLWVEHVLTARHHEDGRLRGIAWMIHDVTAARQAAAEIRSLNVELEDRVTKRTAELAAANADLEAFTSSVSHDLRAPLRAIDGFVRILQEDFGAELPSEARAHLETVSRSARSMRQLIDDLLSFSRLGKQPLQRRIVNVGALVRDVLAESEVDRAGRRLTIELGALSNAWADGAMLRVVFHNLISNALKFTRDRDPAHVWIDSEPSDEGTVYVVRDDGVGFDMRFVHKLFGVFQRLHRQEEFEGTGVGLALVARIVERHGGRVWAEAEPGKGASFRFVLGAEHDA